ncbi:MAG: glycosyltransferase [Chthonomonadaceae bacterium]|nr:glycosyltransferase [Chthonomonadaceae bacterium]
MQTLTCASFPLVSVIVPAYNLERFVSRTLLSIKAQTYPRWELIVVDDGSTDGTFETVKRTVEGWERTLCLSQPNGGPSSARNNGYARTSPESKYLIYLDGDDLWEPHALTSLVEALEKRPDAVAVHGLARYCDKNDAPIRVGECETRFRRRHGIEGEKLVEWSLERDTTFEVEAVENIITTPGVILLRREVHEKIGGFDTELKGTEDWELWMRFSLMGPIVFLDCVVLNYRMIGSSLSSNGRAMIEDSIRSRLRIFQYLREDQERHRLASLGWHLNDERISREQLQNAKTFLLQGKVVLALRRFCHALRVRRRMTTPVR